MFFLQVTYWNISDSESQRGHTPQYRKRRSTENNPNINSQFFFGKENSNGASLYNLTAEQNFMATVSAVNNGGVGPESSVIEFTTASRGKQIACFLWKEVYFEHNACFM